MAEWTSERSFETRVQNIRGIDNPEFGDRLNRSSAGDIDYFLSPDGQGMAETPTVFDDGDYDILLGGSGSDWFLANLEDDDEGLLDTIIDLLNTDLGDDL
jgi:hypothetical protein